MFGGVSDCRDIDGSERLARICLKKPVVFSLDIGTAPFPMGKKYGDYSNHYSQKGDPAISHGCSFVASALRSSLGQLCRFPRTAEHVSRSWDDLRGVRVQNLVVPVNDCQQRMPYNAHLRICFISHR